MISKIFLPFILLFSNYSIAKISVVTTTTDIKWLVEQIGRNHVNVVSLLSGHEDPHYVDAMPHFIAKAASADVFCVVGLELEVGWVPKVLSRSGNAAIAPGGKGHCDVGNSVTALDVPNGPIDRSMGDVHASGNPHYHLGPKVFLEGGKAVVETLIRIDPPNAKDYQKNYVDLKAKLLQLRRKISSILAPLRGRPIIQYHKEFAYFLHEFGLVQAGAIESVPGVPPSAGRLARVALEAKRKGVALALVSSSGPRALMERFSRASGVPVARIPISITGSEPSKDYISLLTGLAKVMVETASKDRGGI